MANQQLKVYAPHAGPRCSGLERVKTDTAGLRTAEGWATS